MTVSSSANRGRRRFIKMRIPPGKSPPFKGPCCFAKGQFSSQHPRFRASGTLREGSPVASAATGIEQPGELFMWVSLWVGDNQRKLPFPFRSNRGLCLGSDRPALEVRLSPLEHLPDDGSQFPHHSHPGDRAAAATADPLVPVPQPAVFPQRLVRHLGQQPAGCVAPRLGDVPQSLAVLAGTPNMGLNLWGASPLYENGN